MGVSDWGSNHGDNLFQEFATHMLPTWSIFVKVVPTTGPPQTWPSSISAHLLAPIPDPTMHNMYICHRKSGCVRKCEVRARRVRLWPFWHHFAPFWQATLMVHPQTCSNPDAFQNLLLLHDYSMLQSWIWGRRLGRCVLWVTLLRPDKGPNTGNAISPQHMHAFKPDQVWGLRAIKSNLGNLKWSRSRVWVGSGGPKHFLTSASFECTAQRDSFPHPNPHRMCGPILHICRHRKLGLWG